MINVSLIILFSDESLVSESWYRPKTFLFIWNSSETNPIWGSYEVTTWTCKFKAWKIYIFFHNLGGTVPPTSPSQKGEGHISPVPTARYAHADLGVSIDWSLKFHNRIKSKAISVNTLTTIILMCTLAENLTSSRTFTWLKWDLQWTTPLRFVSWAILETLNFLKDPEKMDKGWAWLGKRPI